MDYKTIKIIKKKYNLKKYVNLFDGYTLFDKCFPPFFLVKRNILSRMFKDFKLKYRFFVNDDIEYGRIKDEKFFSDKDMAVDYLWKKLIDYSKEKNDFLLKSIIEEAKKL